ncbi:MAG: hypothetical protein NTY20_04220 [Candidatus Aenigmarchaeota archaeon]|nr:hypothetical protein [Candidatus Aenigmarchaeota archaeon]
MKKIFIISIVLAVLPAVVAGYLVFYFHEHSLGSLGKEVENKLVAQSPQETCKGVEDKNWKLIAIFVPRNHPLAKLLYGGTQPHPNPSSWATQSGYSPQVEKKFNCFGQGIYVNGDCGGGANGIRLVGGLH